MDNELIKWARAVFSNDSYLWRIAHSFPLSKEELALLAAARERISSMDSRIRNETLT